MAYRDAADDRTALRRRAGGLLFALAVHLAVILALLLVVPERLPIFREGRGLSTFNVAPAPKSAERSEQRQEEMKTQRQTQRVIPIPKPRIVVPREQKPVDMPFLEMDKAQLAASDIRRMPSHSDAGSAGGSAGNGAPTYGPGEGPNGVQLFPVEWYREPTDAELASYMPANAPRYGWGIVACKTVENFHVDNCQQISESPLGSGYARAVRQAAWQFLVRPPRINGRPQLGTWVSIRIEYGRRETADGG